MTDLDTLAVAGNSFKDWVATLQGEMMTDKLVIECETMCAALRWTYPDLTYAVHARRIGSCIMCITINLFMGRSTLRIDLSV